MLKYGKIVAQHLSSVQCYNSQDALTRIDMHHAVAAYLLFALWYSESTVKM